MATGYSCLFITFSSLKIVSVLDLNSCTFIPCIQTVPVVQKAVAIADEIQTIHDFEFRHGGIVDSDVPMSMPNHAKT